VFFVRVSSASGLRVFATSSYFPDIASGTWLAIQRFSLSSFGISFSLDVMASLV
jgi:hypothetical protein